MIPKNFVLLMEQCVSHCVYASVRFVFFSFLFLTQAQLLFSSLSFLLQGLAGVPFFLFCSRDDIYVCDQIR
jgi:hypothetical protein